jgi:hypothetical protein
MRRLLGPDDPSQNSVFTRLFVSALERPDAHLADLMIDLREEVARLAGTIGHQQYPAIYPRTIDRRSYATPGDKTLRPSRACRRR